MNKEGNRINTKSYVLDLSIKQGFIICNMFNS